MVWSEFVKKITSLCLFYSITYEELTPIPICVQHTQFYPTGRVAVGPETEVCELIHKLLLDTTEHTFTFTFDIIHHWTLWQQPCSFEVSITNCHAYSTHWKNCEINQSGILEDVLGGISALNRAKKWHMPCLQRIHSFSFSCLLRLRVTVVLEPIPAVSGWTSRYNLDEWTTDNHSHTLCYDLIWFLGTNSTGYRCTCKQIMTLAHAYSGNILETSWGLAMQMGRWQKCSVRVKPYEAIQKNAGPSPLLLTDSVHWSVFVESERPHTHADVHRLV